MNRALLNPFDSSDLPRSIKDYLEYEEKIVLVRFNRHGNILAAVTQKGRTLLWDFDTKTIATVLNSPFQTNQSSVSTSTKTRTPPSNTNNYKSNNNNNNSNNIHTNNTSNNTSSTTATATASRSAATSTGSAAAATTATTTPNGIANGIADANANSYVGNPTTPSSSTPSRKVPKPVSITFLAPGNASTIVIAYDNGVIRVYHTLTRCLISQVRISGMSSSYQVEAHPKLDHLLFVVPVDGLPIMLNLRRGCYQLSRKSVAKVTDPSILVPAPSVSFSSTEDMFNNSNSNTCDKTKTTTTRLNGSNIYHHHETLDLKPKIQHQEHKLKHEKRNSIQEEPHYFNSPPPPPPKTTYANTRISALPEPGPVLPVSMLCTHDEFRRPARRPRTRERCGADDDNTSDQFNTNNNINNSDNDDVDFIQDDDEVVDVDDDDIIPQPDEIISSSSYATANNIANSSGIQGSGGGSKRRPLFCVAFSRHPRRILRAGPTGLLRVFGLTRAPNTKPTVYTAVSLYTLVLASRAAPRTLTVSRRDKLLVNSSDKCLRLYDLRTLDMVAGSPEPPSSSTKKSIMEQEQKQKQKQKQKQQLQKQKLLQRQQQLELEKKRQQQQQQSDSSDDVIMAPTTYDHQPKENGREGPTQNGSDNLITSRLLSNANTYTAAPEATFSEIVNKAQCRSVAFSLDGEFVVGGLEGNSHRIHVWRVHDGQIDVTLEGPKESLVQMLIHPLRPVLISVGSINGGIYIWDRETSENWSAFSTQFSELEANEEYVEREDEFDLVDDDERERVVHKRNEEESGEVDVEGPFRPGWFDSDSESDSFFYVPAKPVPDEDAAPPLLVDQIMSQRHDEMKRDKERNRQDGIPTDEDDDDEEEEEEHLDDDDDDDDDDSDDDQEGEDSEEDSEDEDEVHVENGSSSDSEEGESENSNGSGEDASEGADSDEGESGEDDSQQGSEDSQGSASMDDEDNKSDLSKGTGKTPVLAGSMKRVRGSRSGLDPASGSVSQGEEMDRRRNRREDQDETESEIERRRRNEDVDNRDIEVLVGMNADDNNTIGRGSIRENGTMGGGTDAEMVDVEEQILDEGKL